MASTPSTIYVRREIWGLESGASGIWDPYTLAYAKAVGAMQGRTNETGWTYQAAIHGSYTTPAEPYWNCCQHGGWFFLPWHRMYIYWFEQIVRSIVIQQGGPADWALPYWNWQNNRYLPPAFRATTLPDGTRNPLYTTERNRALNDGSQALRPTTVDSTGAMKTIPFSAVAAGVYGFGGGDSGGQAHFFNGYGELELRPHNAVHGAIGGWMGDPNTAAQDPLFWLHHAMVDRLWNRWLFLDGGRANPTDPTWLDEKFHFYNPSANEVEMSVSEVTSALAMGYRYDDDPPPVALPAPAAHLVNAGVAEVMPDPPPPPDPDSPEGVAAAAPPAAKPADLGVSEPIVLEAQPQTVAIDTTATPNPEATNVAPTEVAQGAVALVVEGIEPEDPAANPYEVYINVPDDTAYRHEGAYFVGFLDFFGLSHVHDGHDGHEGANSRAFDITSLVQQLSALGQWDTESAQVTFRPGRVLEEAGDPRVPAYAAASADKVKIGQVRLVSLEA